MRITKNSRFLSLIKTPAVPLMASIFLLTGCAFIPNLGEKPLPRQDLLAASEQGVNPLNFPTENWWLGYKDSQLNTLIQKALVTSPTMAEAQARVLNAQGLAQQLGAPVLPHLSFDADYLNTKQSYHNGYPTAFVPNGYQDAFKAAFNFNYEIDFWGKNTDRLKAALSQEQIAHLNKRQAELMLTTSIASAYSDLSQLYTKLDTAQESVRVRKQTADLFNKRYKQGLENESVVEQAKANLANAEAFEAELTENLALTKNMLAYLVGEKPDYVVQISRPTLMITESLKTPEFMPADLIARRPDVAALQLQVTAAALNVNVAKAGFYPNVNLQGYWGQQSLRSDNFFKVGSRIGGIGPAIHLPLFQGGSLKGQFKSARADYNLAVASYEDGILKALQEVENAQVSKQSLVQRTAKTKAALMASEKAYKVISNRYNAGLATYLEVLRAEDTMLLARQSMVDIQARQFALDIQLVKALGGGFNILDHQDQSDK